MGAVVTTLIYENGKLSPALPLDAKMAGCYPRHWVDQDLSVSTEYI